MSSVPGEQTKRTPVWKKWWFWVSVFAVGLVFGSLIGGGNDSDTISDTPQSNQVSTRTDDEIKNDILLAVKSSFLGSLVDVVEYTNGNTVIKYKELNASDWTTGDAPEKATIRATATILRKVSEVNNITYQIPGGYSVVVSRSDAQDFLGSFESDDDFRKNIVDGALYDEDKRREWTKRFSAK